MLPKPLPILALLASCCLGVAPAQARVAVFLGVPGPYYYAPPQVYYPPPVVYTPAPIPYIQRHDTASQAPLRCDAGAYICPLQGNASAGAPCACPTEKGRINGIVR